MTVNRPHIFSTSFGQKRPADMTGSLAAGEGQGINAGKPPLEPSLRSADILSYGQRGKVTVSSFPYRTRGIAAVLSAQTIPVLALIAEFVLVSAASFGAGLLYQNYAFGNLPFTEFYFAAALLLTSMLVMPCGLARDYAVTRLLQRPEQLRSVVLHWNSAYLLFAFILFISHATDFYSRGSLIAQYVGGLGVAIGLRMAALARLISFSLRRGALGGKRVVLVGEAAASITLRVSFAPPNPASTSSVWCVSRQASIVPSSGTQAMRSAMSPKRRQRSQTSPAKRPSTISSFPCPGLRSTASVRWSSASLRFLPASTWRRTTGRRGRICMHRRPLDISRRLGCHGRRFPCATAW